MWIEVNHANKRLLFNSDLISVIDPQYDNLRIAVMSTGCAISFTFDTEDELKAFYEGFNLALNGLDFYFEATETAPSGYIKPLLQSKNETLYRYMMLKEVLGERK